MSLKALDLPDRLSTRLEDLPALIGRLTWSMLDPPTSAFARADASLAVADRLVWNRIRGCERREDQPFATLPPSWVLSLVPRSVPFGFRLRLDGNEAEVAVGLPGDVGARLTASLGSMLGGPLVALAPLPRPPEPVHGCLSGVPRAVHDAGGRSQNSRAPSAWLDPLLDSLQGETFTFTLLATPEPPEDVVRRRDVLRAAAKEVDLQHLRVDQLANANRTARRASELLDGHLRRLQEGAADGLWRTSLVVTARDPSVALHALALVAGANRDTAEGATVPLRVHACAASGDLPVHCNVLQTRELLAFCALPARDRRGFSLTTRADFNVEHVSPRDGLAIGEVLDGERPTGQAFAIEPRLLCRHALVAGHTGSGKSTTLRRLLGACLDRKIPFLVLDPVKPVEEEYRDLLRGGAPVMTFRVGAAPREGEAVFQFNPMAFPKGFPLFTHVDHLKAAFTAAFGLSPPGPYLLERALLEAYRRCGWDVGTGQHRRPERSRDPLDFPRLSDLLREVERAVVAARYGGEVTRNLRAALVTRVGNLCIGPKGLSLDTYDQIPDAVLFKSPVVLELRGFGSHEEQALVMGLLLTRLFEYRQAEGLPPREGLRHLLLVEEAHRLLKETAQRSSEEGNMAHQAVEAFCAMIAEIRAYGQGLVIAEQLPSVLASGVVKQAGVKLIHRLTPRDDRDLVGDAMGLTDAQKGALARLATGEAVVFLEGMDGAVRLRVGASTSSAPGPRDTTLDLLRRAAPADVVRLERASERARFAGVLSAPTVTDAADLVFSAAAFGQSPRRELEALRLAVEGAIPGDVDARAKAERLALEEALLRRVVAYRWTHAEWARGCQQMLADLDGYLGRFGTFLQFDPGPYGWCDACPSPCHFLYDGEALSRDEEFAAEFEHARRAPAASLGAALVACVARGVRRRFGTRPGRGAAAGYCALGHASMARGDRLFETDRLLTAFVSSGRKT